jgi:hypothetical protein
MDSEEGWGPQPPMRWHGPGEGPVQYLSDTPTGAWAELLRHEEVACIMPHGCA